MHKEKTQRQKRVNKRIFIVVSNAFNKSEFEVGGKKVLVSVTKVDISPDFRNVSIYLDMTGIPREDKKKIVKELNKEDYVRTMRKIIAQDLNLRVSPYPTFILDKYTEKNVKITSIIEEEAKKYKTEDDGTN